MPVTVWSGRAWLVPILVALVGSLLLVPGLPADGVDGEVDHPAVYSACVGPATASAGFTDMVGSFAEEAADCLAHYGITKGTTATTFSPSDQVTRVQMAQFLTRAARPAGITLPSAGSQGFTDLADLNAGDQAAINAMAALGIMRPKTKTTFAPTDSVKREEMAVHLAAFLALAAIGPGGVDIDKITADDTVFTDLRRVSERAYRAIHKLYEMGVTKGTKATIFSPKDPVKRGQMAAFITRTLAHTNARPAGVTIQPSGGAVGFQDDLKKFSVSVRDDQHRPMRGVRVDMFYAWGARARSTALTGDGRCGASVRRLRGERACVIDGLDLRANSYGNLSGEPSLRLDDDVTVWAWTGAMDARFEKDKAGWGSVDVVAAENPVYVRVEADIPGHEDRPQRTEAVSVPYGTTVSFTLQTLDSNRRPVAREGVKILVNSSITTATNTVVSSWRGTMETDSSGRLQLSYTRDDPDRGRNDTPLTLVWKVQSGGGFGSGRFVLDPDGNWLHRSGGDATFTVRWDDDTSRPTLLSVEPRRRYVIASASGSQGGVVATLLDQYGDPVSNAPIKFTSNDSHGIGSTPRTVRTSSGEAIYSYRRAKAHPGAEKVTATYRSTGGDLTANGCHFWAAHPSTSHGTAATILFVDTRENLILVDQSGPRVFTYSDGARFTVGTGPTAPSLVEGFEREIDAGDQLTWDYRGSVDTYELVNEDPPLDLC